MAADGPLCHGSPGPAGPVERQAVADTNRAEVQRGEPPTLKDVAALAGVSTMTVSNVINAKSARVRGDTRDRVLAAVAELGYRPHLRGRSLRTQRHYAIGLVVIHPDRKFLDDPFVTEVAAGMSNFLAREGYSLAIRGYPNAAALREDRLSPTGLDAVAVMASGPRASRDVAYLALADMRHPLAIIQDSAPEGLPDAFSVRQDDAGGARAVAELLLSAGATSLLFVAPRRMWPAVERREAAVRLAAKGRAAVTHLSCNEERFGQIVATIVEELSRGTPPDAVVGANDQIAIAALQAAVTLGLVVPRDLSVTGFNAFGFRDYVRPLITSVISPAYSIGEETANQLVRRVAVGSFVSHEYIFKTVLAPGESTRS